jgi:hypothetical protein
MKKAQAAIVILLSLIFVALLIVIILQISDITITGMAISNQDSISSEVISKTYDFKNFQEIEIRGKGELFLTQGNEYSIEIIAEEHIIKALNTRTQGNKLIIGDKVLIFNKKPIKIYVTMPEINKINILGSGDIEAQNLITSEKLEVTISGSGDVNMDLNLDELKTKIAGSGNAYYTGQARKQTISISGSGDINAFDLITKITEINIAGSGDAKVHASEELNIKITGSGDVDYKARPRITQSVSGSGNIKSS